MAGYGNNRSPDQIFKDFLESNRCANESNNEQETVDRYPSLGQVVSDPNSLNSYNSLAECISRFHLSGTAQSSSNYPLGTSPSRSRYLLGTSPSSSHYPSGTSLSRSNCPLELNQSSQIARREFYWGRSTNKHERRRSLTTEAARPSLINDPSTVTSHRRDSTASGSGGRNLSDRRSSIGSSTYSESEAEHSDNKDYRSTCKMAVLSDSEKDVEESMDSIRDEDDDSSRSGNQILENSYRNAFEINKILELTNLRRLAERGGSTEMASSLSANGASLPSSLSMAGAAALLPQSLLAPALMPGYPFTAVRPIAEPQAGNPSGTDLLARAFVATRGPRKPRGEKKPIPNDLKDTRYFERRKRNNAAAKKSRDARKQREDEIAKKATVLQNENDRLRDELRMATFNLQSMLLQAIRRGIPIFSLLSGPQSDFMSQVIQQTKVLYEATRGDFD